MNHKRNFQRGSLDTRDGQDPRVLRGVLKRAGTSDTSFDIGHDQLIAFLEPNGVPDVPASYDAGITSVSPMWYVRAEGRFLVPAH